MKGLIKVTPESLFELARKSEQYMQSFDKEKFSTNETRWSWRKFKKIDVTVYSELPFWYAYKIELIMHMKSLSDMAYRSIKTGDEIWLSELSYCHLVKLSNADETANPIYIIDY